MPQVRSTKKSKQSSTSGKERKSAHERDSLENQVLRAEDIILGSLGFGEEARIVSIESCEGGFRGKGEFSDGEVFDFESSEPLSQIEEWALRELLTVLSSLG
jgi:hypothetical protein